MIFQVPAASMQPWYVVVINGTRHWIPTMDTMDGLELPESTKSDYWFSVAKGDLALFPDGDPVVKCDKAETPNKCKDSVYYKAFHGSV